MTIDAPFVAAILPQLARASLVTIEAAILSMALAMLLAVPLVLAGRAANPMLRFPARALVEFVRNTPLLTQLFFLYLLLPAAIPPLVIGVVALGLHNSTYLSEVYRAGIEGIPRGQWEAASALGLSRARTWARIVLPQAMFLVIPVLGNYQILIFKETAILSTVTVKELLGTALEEGAYSYRYVEPLLLVGAFYLSISYIASIVQRRLEVRYRNQ